MKYTENMNEKIKRKKSKNKIKKLLISFLVLAVCIVTGTVVAKYYSSKYRPGIAVASGFYFNSNRLLKVPGDTRDITAINTTGMMVNVNGDKWSGGNLYFDIEIRNYDNNLLFNDSNLNVGYEICFYLLGEPVGATYYAQDIDGTEKMLSADHVVKFNNGYLPGGTLSKDSYRIRINLTNGNIYEPVKVLVVAYPTSPDYLANTQNQEQRLVGLFEGVYSETYMQVEDAYFLVEDDTDYNDSSWSDKVEDLSGLIFNIKTKGDVVTDENNAVKQEAIVRWQSNYIEISEYDEYYIAAKERQAAISAGEEDYIWTETDEAGNVWTYMKIEILPYTNVNITFYKTEQFLSDFENGIITKDKFENLADAYTQE